MFLLPCDCSEKIAVSQKQSGMEIKCSCGRWVAVPSLSVMKRLEEASQHALPTSLPSRVPASVGMPAVEKTEKPHIGESAPAAQQDDENESTCESSTKEKQAVSGVSLPLFALFGLTAVVLLTLFLYSTGKSSDKANIAELVDTEEWILELTPRLSHMSSMLSSINEECFDAKELFAERFEHTGLRTKSDAYDVEPLAADTTSFRWPVDQTPTSVSADAFQLWKPLLNEIVRFDHEKFYFARANYDPVSPMLIESEVGFGGLARTESNETWNVSAKVLAIWRNESTGNTDSPNWKIVSWKTKSLSVNQRSRKMFREVLDLAIPDAKLRERIRKSEHEERLAKMLTKQPNEIDNLQFSQLELSTAEHHPGLAVVDIDGDGFDDLYVMPRWGRNILLRNRGDETFEDIAAKSGLDIEDRCTSAVFADFDNDGDQDLIVGRSLKPSIYLRNDGGMFSDRSKELVDCPMPALVFSVSAADYNRDGLLDVYFATSAVKASTDALQSILPWENARKLKEHLQQISPHTILAKPGPPNILLVNRGGGRFSLAPEQDQVAIFRNTNQASWADYDKDGDPDLYLSNDFSINTLLRNDGESGFVDVTQQTGTADIGFGMGAAWGDFDNDQHLDLYATNMFSKAGRRITAQISELDSRFANMARGNSLFKNRDGGFEKVSGLQDTELQVEKAGWSWCGQFVDVNNDGYLDIYAPNGYYTAPPEVAVEVDL